MSASLDQAEQLSRAAEMVSPAAQPLPLFYALGQAGRAIAAVHLKDDWQLSGHGLKWPGDAGSGDLLTRVVEPKIDSRGSFQRVAEAVGSATLQASVQLGAIWMALPELALPQLPRSEPNWRAALRVHSLEPDTPISQVLTNRVEGFVVGLADVNSRQAILEQLQHYPSARDGSPVVSTHNPEELVGRFIGPDQWLPRIRWQAENSTRTSRDATLDHIAPPYQSRSQNIAIPSLPTGDWLNPLMLWWVLLFGLSNLARYEPAAWTAAIDVNTSKLAVPLEAAMREACDSVPHLVLEALLGQFVERNDY
jgi:hypothetical protein